MNRKISVIGLGYVGLPVAVAFGNFKQTIGFDIFQNRIEELAKGFDATLEVSSEGLKASNILFTSKVEDLKKADFHIVAVPTPVNDAHNPDLSPMLGASRTLGQALKKGDIVVYESTVYPGVTEEECVPVLEEVSGLKCGVDFKVGYSPERINPGDKEHTFTKILKIVSGQDQETLDIVAEVYESVVTAGVYKASSIKVAEAAKVIENTQRDINIALMNELSIIFDKVGIDTIEVLKAAGTKWNFLPFRPGLVGGHCIGVDPYYLTYKAEQLGYNPQMILAGRRINDGMGKFIAEQTVKEMIKQGIKINGSKVTVLGLTFKEDCPDLRNSRVVDIIKELKEFKIDVQVSDAASKKEDAKKFYNVELKTLEELEIADAVILAVAHKEYKEMNIDAYKKLLTEDGMITDVKDVLDPAEVKEAGIHLWRL